MRLPTIAAVLIGALVALRAGSANGQAPDQCLIIVDLAGSAKPRAWCSEALSLSARQPRTGVRVIDGHDRLRLLVTLAAFPIRVQMMILLDQPLDLKAAKAIYHQLVSPQDVKSPRRPKPPPPARIEGDYLLPCSKSNPPCLPGDL